MELLQIRPGEIEKRSFEIIEKELQEKNIALAPGYERIIKRCIHTTADFDYADTLCFSENALEILKKLIRSGADMVTDTNMALSGINKKEFLRYGGSICCFMADEEVVRKANELQITRASVSMQKAMASQKETIFVVGNAPTALAALYEQYAKGLYRPAFVIGVPVGFVNVEAAKELILKSGIPYIVNRGRKGGSTVAAAICNAVLYEMREEA